MYRHVISLGEACDVAHNIRRVFGIETAQFFDWHVTPFDGLIAAIAADLDGVGDAVLLRKNRNTVVDTTYRIQLQHAFSRDEDGLITKTTVRREYDTMLDKMRFLRARWLDTLRSEGPFLFVMRHHVDQSQIDALYGLLKAKTGGPCHLRCLHLPEQTGGFVATPGVSHAVVRENRSWMGDADSWDDALADIDYPRPADQDPPAPLT